MAALCELYLRTPTLRYGPCPCPCPLGPPAPRLLPLGAWGRWGPRGCWLEAAEVGQLLLKQRRSISTEPAGGLHGASMELALMGPSGLEPDANT